MRLSGLLNREVYKLYYGKGMNTLKKINLTSVLTIAGMALTVGGSIVSAIAGQKKNNEELAKLVEAQTKNK